MTFSRNLNIYPSIHLSIYIGNYLVSPKNGTPNYRPSLQNGLDQLTATLYTYLSISLCTNSWSEQFWRDGRYAVYCVHKSIIITFSVNLSLVFIKKFGRKRFNSNHGVESLFSLILPLVFILKYGFYKFQNQPPGEPREHHLVEVLQGRSKYKYNIPLVDSKVFFLVQVSIIQTI